MNYKTFLDTVSNKFDAHINGIASTQLIETEDFGWYNIRFCSELFRLAHIERYSDEKIEVLHLTTFPHAWSPEPIFGFDVICTNNIVVGAYMDLSPGIITYPFDDGIQFQERKPLPEWATVFSSNFILLKPTSDDEFLKFVNWALEKYAWYLEQLSKKIQGNEQEIIAMQNKYCEVQASNPRTFSVLKTKIGEMRAKHFMENILFPKIEVD